MADTTIELVLNGRHLDDTDLALAVECSDIASIEAESREAREALDSEPSVTSATTLPQVEVFATSIRFET
jgi:hypothetical protein